MRLIGAILTAVVPAAAPARSQETGAIDPVTVSPDKYKVLLENDYVRVVEYTLKPARFESHLMEQSHSSPSTKTAKSASGAQLLEAVLPAGFKEKQHSGPRIRGRRLSG